MHFSEPGIESYLQRQPQLMRLITCGSVDDGKSTLLGRLLYDSDVVFDDQLSRLLADSKRFGTQGEQLDFALLLDGLTAEREQGITIDIAFRFFTTPKRKFIIINSPATNSIPATWRPALLGRRRSGCGRRFARLSDTHTDAPPCSYCGVIRHSPNRIRSEQNGSDWI